MPTAAKGSSSHLSTFPAPRRSGRERSDSVSESRRSSVWRNRANPRPAVGNAAARVGPTSFTSRRIDAPVRRPSAGPRFPPPLVAEEESEPGRHGENRCQLVKDVQRHDGGCRDGPSIPQDEPEKPVLSDTKPASAPRVQYDCEPGDQEHQAGGTLRGRASLSVANARRRRSMSTTRRRRRRRPS